MKETQWDDSIDDSKEFFDSAAILPIDEADDVDDTDEEVVQTAPSKTQLFDYDDLDGLLDSMR